jgi:hypothetical protein
LVLIVRSLTRIKVDEGVIQVIVVVQEVVVCVSGLNTIRYCRVKFDGNVALRAGLHVQNEIFNDTRESDFKVVLVTDGDVKFEWSILAWLDCKVFVLSSCSWRPQF